MKEHSSQMNPPFFFYWKTSLQVIFCQTS
ncbi:hypothetical protein DNTS_003468 [Danionella cerebrum]|uniref:Uncharacterized protein n=1 Tax=Danionella cerebrum TaxID=2873325 RepID=A0A553QH89_9TELE|nr:hypothetical protein DNTS_003468 [Danionella translucida]